MKMSTIDWLHIYAEAIKSYGMDMPATFRFACNPAKASDDEAFGVAQRYTQEMQATLGGGNRQVTWDQVAEYASFIEKLYAQGYQAINEDDKASVERY